MKRNGITVYEHEQQLAQAIDITTNTCKLGLFAASCHVFSHTLHICLTRKRHQMNGYKWGSFGIQIHDFHTCLDGGLVFFKLKRWIWVKIFFCMPILEWGKLPQTSRSWDEIFLTIFTSIIAILRYNGHPTAVRIYFCSNFVWFIWLGKRLQEESKFVSIFIHSLLCNSEYNNKIPLWYIRTANVYSCTELNVHY